MRFSPFKLDPVVVLKDVERKRRKGERCPVECRAEGSPELTANPTATSTSLFQGHHILKLKRSQ